VIPQEIQGKPRVNREKQRREFNHGEAFCHMMYMSDDGRQIEWLWNSRDGVTPFVISSPTGKAMQHSYFGEDRFDPNYVPKPGDRIFVDCLPDMIRNKAREYVEKFWEEGSIPMSRHPFFEPLGKEASVRHFIEEWTKPGSPHVLTISDEDMALQFSGAGRTKQ
jgi:hypothetical protein